MNIYILDADANQYQNIVPEEVETWMTEFRRFDGTSIANSWRPITVHILDDDQHKNHLPGDFPSLASHIPVFSQHAIEVLGDILKDSGEILSLDCINNDIYFAFNVTRLIDALNTESSEIKYFEDSNRIMRIIRHVFYTDKLCDISIFKLPQLPLMNVFVTDTFVKRVQESNLLGFHFRSV